MKLNKISLLTFVFGCLMILSSCNKELPQELIPVNDSKISLEAEKGQGDCLAFYCDPNLLNQDVEFFQGLSSPLNYLGDVLTTYFTNRCFAGGCVLLNTCEEETVSTQLDAEYTPNYVLYTSVVTASNLQIIKDLIYQKAIASKPSSSHKIKAIDVYSDGTTSFRTVFLEIEYVKTDC